MESASAPGGHLARLPGAAAAAIAATAAMLAPARAVPTPRPTVEPGIVEPGIAELAALDQRIAAGRPHRPEHLAAPGSPVARVNADPRTTSPLHRLTTRLGRPLVDLATLTDAELHAAAGLVLAEQHRRAARWFDTA